MTDLAWWRRRAIAWCMARGWHKLAMTFLPMNHPRTPQWHAELYDKWRTKR